MRLTWPIFNSGHVFAIGVATNTITAAIPTGPGPEAVYISPDGTRAYVANANANDVAVIDTATNTVTATIPAGGEPVGVLMSGTTAYVADAASNTVAVIDTATSTVTATIAVGDTPCAIAQAPVFQPSAVTAVSRAAASEPSLGARAPILSGHAGPGLASRSLRETR